MAAINRAYKRDIDRGFGAFFFPGQFYAFYLNFSNPVSDPDFANFRLDLRRAEAGSVAIATDIGTLTQDFIDPPYNIFYSIIIEIANFPGVPFGWYQFAIVDTVSNETKAVSSLILVEEQSMVKNYARITWRNSINREGINYEGNPDFYNTLTVPLIQTDFNIEQDRKTYRNVSDRKLRAYKAFIDEVVKIESYYYDEEGHKAIAKIFDNDQIWLDLTNAVAKDVYQIEDRALSVVSKGFVNAILDDSIPHPHPNWVIPPNPEREYADEYDGDFD